MKVNNAVGRIIETEIAGKKFEPFKGAKKYPDKSKIVGLKEALENCKLKDGQTISFHHQLRNGDYVVNLTLEEISRLGVKNIRLAQTALFSVHEPVIDYIKEGMVTRIEGSINGIVGDYVSKHPLKSPVILRSHGGRWAAVKSGELHPNIAIIAASAADKCGNCTGTIGKNAFGPLCY
jgi:citrate lyase subunit alpha/citrate CoA-transferase